MNNTVEYCLRTNEICSDPQTSKTTGEDYRYIKLIQEWRLGEDYFCSEEGLKCFPQFGFSEFNCKIRSK